MVKILGISGGTVNGNNDAMCKYGLKGAMEAGASVEFINLNRLDIKHCTGCKACVMSLFSGKGSFCSLKDDFDWLLDQIYDADGILWSIPIFEKGSTGLFHTLTDRFGPRMDRGNVTIADKIAQDMGGKRIDPRFLQDKYASYMGIGGSDWTTLVESDFAMQALTPMWKVVETKVFPWSLDIIGNDEAIEKAKDIGKNLVEAIENPEEEAYRGDEGMCPHCHSKNFYFDNDGKAICCVCGIEGTLDRQGSKYVFTFPEDQLKHAHNTLSGKFIHGDDIQRNEKKAREVLQSDKVKQRKKELSSFLEAKTPVVK